MDAMTGEIKTCSICGFDKPLSDYYIQTSNRKPAPNCKSCHIERNRTYRQRSASEPSRVSEQIVVDEMRRNRIYACMGRETAFPYVDAVAWGCVRIEIKTGEFRHSGKGLWVFRFTNAQIERGIQGDAVVLVVPYKSGNEYHIFKSDHPLFYSTDGKLRRRIGIVPTSNYVNSWTPEFMHHKNAWGIIEDCRQEISAQMISGTYSVTQSVRVYRRYGSKK